MQTLHLINAWLDFYSNPASPASIFQKEKYENITKAVSSGSQYVYSCYFVDCSAKRGGGILATSETNILIEETTFSSCKATSGDGGGIFFEITGNCVLCRVCSFACTAPSNGAFCYVKLPVDLSYNNSMKDSSILYSNCPSAYRTIWLSYGKIFVSSINSSNNIGYQYVGIFVTSISSCDFSDCLISFSCFSNNKATHSVYVVYDGSGKGEMRSCNVMNNIQGQKSAYGAIYANSPLNVYDSYVIINDGDQSFHGFKCTINLYRTIFDKTNNNYVFVKEKATSFINDLVIFKTGECDAEKAKSKKTHDKTCTIYYKRSATDGLTMFKLSCLILLCK